MSGLSIVNPYSGGGSSFGDLSGAPSDNAALAAAIGRMLLRANEFIPNVTDGGGVTTIETATHDVMADYVTFATAVDRSAQVDFLWPEGWNTFDVTAVVEASDTGLVRLAAKSRVWTSGDDADSAWGSEAADTFDVIAANTVYYFEIGPVTPSGTVGTPKIATLYFRRNGTFGADENAGTLRLRAVILTRVS